MTITQAIEKAVAGGWDDTNYAFGSDKPETSMAKVWGWEYDEKVLLDPAFWRALGKTEGWNATETGQCTNGGYNSSRETKGGIKRQEKCAHCQMHRLIDHLADGGSIESYFETL